MNAPGRRGPHRDDARDHAALRRGACAAAGRVARRVANRFPPTSTASARRSACSASRCRRRSAGLGADVRTYAAVMEELVARLRLGRRPVRPGRARRHAARHARHAGAGRALAAAARALRAPLRLRLTEAEAGSDVAEPQDHGGARRRRLAPDRREAVDPQRARRRLRARARAHRPAGGQARHEHLHRRPRRARLLARPRRSTRWGSAPRRSARCTSTTSAAARDALLGPAGRGFHMMMSVLDKGRVGIAALAVGILQARAGGERSTTRRRATSSARRSPSSRRIQWMLADMAKDIRGRAAARRRRGRAARPRRARDAGIVDGEVLRGRRRGGAHRRTPCRSTAAAATSAASTVERLYRDAKITQIYEGTNQIQRMIIARQLLLSKPQRRLRAAERTSGWGVR